jgi:hypothetical protein
MAQPSTAAAPIQIMRRHVVEPGRCTGVPCADIGPHNDNPAGVVDAELRHGVHCDRLSVP